MCACYYYYYYYGFNHNFISTTTTIDEHKANVGASLSRAEQNSSSSSMHTHTLLHIDDDVGGGAHTPIYTMPPSPFDYSSSEFPEHRHQNTVNFPRKKCSV